MQDHRRLIQERFGKQAAAYAGSHKLQKASFFEALMEDAAPSARDRALDVACGPGRLALLLARRAGLVVGLDLTPEMIGLAEAARQKEGLHNVIFMTGDGQALSFPDGAFDLVCTTASFHHFPDPRPILAEMVRVTRPGGRVAVADWVSDPDPARAERHNAIERLRDPSHVHMFAVDRLQEILEAAGLRVLSWSAGELERELGEWLAIAGASPQVGAKVRQALLDTVPGNSAGMDVREAGGRVCFTHRWAVGVAGRPQT
ncbi:MAG: methyltransferase domain-containing protein [Armatimonadetes bacterium]|nr:methyltransferase domain-containing protein [Armatimonadota bacterium]